LNGVFNEMGGKNPTDHGQWSHSRYALFFHKGYHHVSVQVGYYTTVHGLGKTPNDTALNGLAVFDGSWNPHNGALSTFWRSAENVAFKG